MLDPVFQGGEQVMLGVRRRRVPAGTAELIRPGAATAMKHARDHEQAHELGRCLLAAHARLERLLVVDNHVRRHRRVHPALVEDRLAAPSLEGPQVG